MKTILVIVATFVYTIGAVATFNADRELGRAHCWKSESNNSAISSLNEAAMWPVAAFLFGSVVIMTNHVEPFVCAGQRR